MGRQETINLVYPKSIYCQKKDYQIILREKERNMFPQPKEPIQLKFEQVMHKNNFIPPCQQKKDQHHSQSPYPLKEVVSPHKKIQQAIYNAIQPYFLGQAFQASKLVDQALDSQKQLQCSYSKYEEKIQIWKISEQSVGQNIIKFTQNSLSQNQQQEQQALDHICLKYPQDSENKQTQKDINKIFPPQDKQNRKPKIKQKIAKNEEKSELETQSLCPIIVRQKHFYDPDQKNANLYELEDKATRNKDIYFLSNQSDRRQITKDSKIRCYECFYDPQNISYNISSCKVCKNTRFLPKNNLYRLYLERISAETWPQIAKQLNFKKQI